MGVTETMQPRLRPLARFLWPLAIGNLLVNILIVVTGAAVRLTGSGLGCPEWPRCTPESFAGNRHGPMGYHQLVEFGNRLVTFLVVGVAILCLLAAVGAAHRRATRLSLLICLYVPVQALIGGVTVLTHLNPWVVGLHMVASLVIIQFCVALLDELRSPGRDLAPVLPRALAFSAYAVGWAALYLGTVVTGSGPHAGDLQARRNGMDPAVTSQVHAVSAYLLVVLTVALLVVAVRRGDHWLATVTGLVMVIEVLQGVLGWVQYALGLPVLLVALHMLLAASLAAGLARIALAVLPHRAELEAGQSADPQRAATSLRAGE